MYLTKINKKTGLVDIEDLEDGPMCIRAFRDVIEDKDLGIECFTAIAMTVDYKSPIRFYNDADRPRKAMEEVTGERDKWTWNQEKIQVALKKYDELQYDPTLVEGQIHYQRKVSKLKEFQEAEKYYGKKHNLKDDNGEPKAFANPATIATQLRKINDDIKEYEKMIQGKDIYENAPSKNGYKLSRLEQKIEKKNSFYHEIR